MRDSVLYWYARLFSKTRFVRLNNFIFEIALRGLGVLNYKDFKISGERFFLNFIQSKYSLDIVFDVGANRGQYASLFNGAPKVYSFEPNPRSYKVLDEKFRNSDSHATFEFGFSDSEGTVKIYDRMDDEGSAHASIFEKVITDLHKSPVLSTEIRLKTIDNFVRERSIEKISLLKIDTEGNELAVLKGAAQSLKSKKIEVIHIEFNEMNIISRVFLKDFIDLLEDFNLYRLLPNEFLPIKYHKEGPVRYEIFAFQNIVAFRKDIDAVAKR